MSSGLIDEAICIRHWEWSETSQTAALFTLGHGVVRVLAKGSRRPKAPYSGGLELLTRAEIGLILRPNSELALLTWWDLKEAYPVFRTSLEAHNVGIYIADMVFQFVRDHDAHPDLYRGVLESLHSMQAGGSAQETLLRFQWSLLAASGFIPSLDADARTGEELPERSDYLFNPGLGGLVADPDEAVSGEAARGAWRVRAETVRLLRLVAGAPPSDQPPPAFGPEVVDRANRLLASYSRHILGFETGAMTALFGDRLAQ